MTKVRRESAQSNTATDLLLDVNGYLGASWATEQNISHLADRNDPS